MVTIPDHLLPTSFPLAQQVRTLRAIKVKPGTTIEMVLDPDFWKHGAGALKVDDQIEVTAQDGSFYLEVRIVAVDLRGNWAHVEPIGAALGQSVPAPAKQKEPLPKTWPDADGYRIEWSGSPAHRWRIIDRAGDVVASRLHTEEAAEKHLAEIKREKVAA